jgi:excisionase family DNA binding protein
MPRIPACRRCSPLPAPDAWAGVTRPAAAFELKVSVQTIYDLRSKGRGPRGFRVGTQLRFRESEIDAWVQRMELADEKRHAGGAS